MGWFISIFFTIAGLVLFILALYKDSEAAGMGVLGLIFLAIGLTLISAVSGRTERNRKPSPIDVYRGRTTLQITYMDTIPVDTVVVWKDEFNPKNKK